MPRPASDPELLVCDLAAGREEAFAALYDRFGAPMFRAAVGMLGSREEAEDAVQEVFVGLVRAGKSLKEVRHVAGYLFAALRNAAAERGRRRARRDAAEALRARQGEAGAAEPGAPAPNRAEDLARARAALPEAQQEVLALKVDAGLTFAEIAEATGVSPNTAASRYRYALERLRAALKED